VTRLMYDSIEPLQIPSEAQKPGIMVAGYVNGAYEWPADQWGRWPRNSVVHIDVNGTHPQDADVLDVEKGDATPAMVPGWIDKRLKYGPRACVYTTISQLQAVANAVAGRHGVDLWLADPDGQTNNTAAIPSVFHLVAKQYLWLKTVDLSVVYDSNWPWEAPKVN
jgi:hypothetical protein